MTGTIYHIKLTTGEDIFGQLIETGKTSIEMREVLVMETISFQESKYMFMTRYTPFSDSPNILINKDQIVFGGEVSEVVKNHYETSLSYCQLHSDSKFEEGIVSGTTFLAKMIAKEFQENETDMVIDSEELGDRGDRLLAKLKSSSTKH